MFTFHEVMNQLQEMEEQVVDDHRVCLEVREKEFYLNFSNLQ